MAKGDDIEERLIGFGVRIIGMTARMPKSAAGVHVSNQLLRCGTAPAAHYAEARGAESRRDFVHKLKIALKELNESRVWLLMIQGSELLPPERLHEITKECDELCYIISASIRTATSGGN